MFMSRLSVKPIDANVMIPEDYSTLRINVEFLASGRSIRTLAVASSRRGEGRTATAVHLGMAYAKAGKRTVIVDADLRNPGVHHTFGVDPVPGLSDLLAARLPAADLIRQTPMGRLSILPSGPSTLHASELLTSPYMEEVLAGQKERFDIILLDTPPLQYIEAKIMAAKCDGAILVLEYGKITREAAQRTKEELASMQVNLLGTVLNKSKS